ncbi:helix-turn-helix transcriptional regulator [Arthrospiribacter ruber]|uniref:Helix-turn-helix transcriptional regulator n=1 Tax=Arthrospiribacter ruber TaxID=2487934 RepID=A0A951IYX3_9BACT|nr:helix-turn-helix transcriptional regulator [Arthrospiribacter ruber]MBW3469755.1 helix-turn-helix transcriptional regulator [Arthrospiribacter ruber]
MKRDGSKSEAFFLKKLRRTILTLTCCLFFSPVFSQEIIIKQLKQDLITAPRDTNKVWIYRDLAFYYQDQHSDSVIYFADEGAKLAIQLNFIRGQIWSLYQKALALEYLNRFEEAMEVFAFMKSLSLQSKDSLSLAKVTNAIGVAYYYQGIQDQALENFQQGFDLSEHLGYLEGMSQALNNLAVIYRQQRNFRRAMEVHQKSLEIKNSQADTVGMINSHYNLGLLYAYLNDYPKSLLEFQKADALSSNTASSHNLAEINIGKAVAFYHLGNDTLAYKLLSEEVPKLKPDKIHEKAAALTYLGIVEIKLDKNGINKLLEARELLENSDRLELRRLLYKELALAYELTGDPGRSVRFWKEYNLLNDSINNEQKAWAIEEMQARFDAIEKDKKIQQQEMALFSEQSKKKNISIILTLLFFAFTISLFFYVKKWRKQVKIRQEELEQKNNSGNLDFAKINLKMLSPLTKREIEIIRLVEEGKSNQEIANQLFVSENTIKTHLKNIFSKTEANNRTDLIHRLHRY